MIHVTLKLHVSLDLTISIQTSMRPFRTEAWTLFLTLMKSTHSQHEIQNTFLLDEANLLYFLLDLDGTIIESNSFSKALLGSGAINTDFADIVVDFNNTFNLSEFLENTTPALLTISVPNKNPQSYYFTFRQTDSSITVFGQEDTGALGQLQGELLIANQELNNLTRSLHKKNAQLHNLNKIKNQFLGMAAHDLRRPISVVLNYTEFVLDEAKNTLQDEHVGFLKKIEDSASHMKRMVDDFLDVSAIESGNFPLLKTQADLETVLQRSLAISELLANKKGVSLNITIEPDLPKTDVDVDKVEQAMSNLLVNAIEHSHPGHSVFVSLHQDTSKIHYTVRDTGVGMDKETQKSLFTPFRVSKNCKTSGEKSTGLGLAITKQIVKAHGAEISVESEKGAGSAFTIMFNT